MNLPDTFDPFDMRTQPHVPIENYANTWRHTPLQKLHRRPVTLTEMTAPLTLSGKLPCGDSNLAELSPGKYALGQMIRISGRILDEDARPVPNAIVELWQANAAGRYFHTLDDRAAPLDPNFLGNGRVLADAEGRYDFFTIRPGAYPVIHNTGFWWRPAHVHFSVIGPADLSRLVTQMYFPDDHLHIQDRIMQSIPDPDARQRLIATPILPAVAGTFDWLAYTFDIVLRGRRATPPA